MEVLQEAPIRKKEAPIRKIVGCHKIDKGDLVYLTPETEGMDPAEAGQRVVGKGLEIVWRNDPKLALTIDNGMPLYVVKVDQKSD